MRRRAAGWLGRLPSRVAELAADEPVLGAVRDAAPLVLALGAGGAAGWRAGGRHRSWGAALLVLAAAVTWCFRDPPRRCPGAAAVVYAPADGTVLAVDEVTADWFLEGPALRVVIFLSLLDVHVTRSPVAGRLVATRRETGGFAPAFHVGRSTGNARLLLGIRHRGSGRRLVLAQIVGVLARRIVPWRGPGDELVPGQKLGLLRFGSRVDVLLPAGTAEPLVRPADRVRAGLTPVARLRATDTTPVGP